ncbi:hypothetical protein VPH35_122792 [Triticum aestivum]
MAARSDDPDVSPESSSPAAAAGGEIWGTLEELLLACAVSRHGTSSWESVASEVQSRSPSAAARLTPTSCRLRFRLLHRRFAAGADEDGGGEPDPNAAVSDAWVDELRKLRVAELRREVERYDLSIGSLQSKVKRLKEERERSLSGETTPAFKDERETGNDSPEEAGGENGLSGEASARSCKESNSSDLKPPPGHDSGGAAADHDAEVKDEPAAGEMAAKDEASGESAAGSKEADAVKESSDVQSSASPSRKRRRRLRKVGGGDVASTSAPVPLPAAEAQPLLAFLESVRTSKSGAVFERRLESQATKNTTATIHVCVASKLEQPLYTSSSREKSTWNLAVRTVSSSRSLRTGTNAIDLDRPTRGELEKGLAGGARGLVVGPASQIPMSSLEMLVGHPCRPLGTSCRLPPPENTIQSNLLQIGCYFLHKENGERIVVSHARCVGFPI